MKIEEQIGYLRQLISENEQIVCLLGIGMAIECGLHNHFSPDVAYDIEDRYGLSPEEIFSAAYYCTKKDLFFKFYKEELINLNAKPSPAYDALYKLQKMGKISSIVTKNIQSMASLAGLVNVIELNGSIYDNECPKCHKRYDVSYIKNSHGVPLCEDCKQPIRPLVTLFGEAIRNDRMTMAANACQDANLILVLGTNLNDVMVKSFLEYYHGEKVVLITKNSHYSDKFADLCLYGEVQDILPRVCENI